MSAQPLAPGEEEKILSEWDRLQAEPQPTDDRSVGCVLIIVAVALVILGPRLVPWLKMHVAAWAGTAGVLLALLILLYGLYQNFFGNKTGAQAYRRSEAALLLLSQRFETSSVEERRSAAVAAIYYAYYSGGPYMASSYDVAEWKTKLGAALEFVKRTEMVLVEKRQAYNVFSESTTKKEEPGGAGTEE
ncbi:MAG: hypothetical protein ACJ71N_05375 [Terriglobales bacterium]|jgi:hypothetical protein